MNGGTIFVLVLAFGFLALVIFLHRLSRGQQADSGAARTADSEQSPPAEETASQEGKARRREKRAKTG